MASAGGHAILFLTRIAAVIVAAAKLVIAPEQMGNGMTIPRLLPPQWQPDTLVHYDLQYEDLLKGQWAANKQLAKQAQPVGSHKRRRQGPCHFGHTTTSLVDYSGTPRWNAAPTKPTLWKGMPPGATLCQRCYEHYRMPFIRGIE